jgi:PAS domain S-box-containing protein
MKMPAELFLLGAIILQVAAAAMAYRLIRITGRLSAWILISIALALMALRRIIPFARMIIGGSSAGVDPLNEFIGFALSAFMLAGIAMIGPIFERIFRSEEALKESERRFRSYFELPLVGVAIASKDRRWVTVNDRLCEILGLSRQELASTTIDAVTFPDDAAAEGALDRSLADRLADGYSLDKRFLRKGGEPIWASQAVRGVRDRDGSIGYLVVIVQDISERKKAEEGLRSSLGEKEALLRELYHRTKNNMQMICSLLHLESAQCDDPKLTEEFQAIEDRIASMSLVHEMLYVSRDLSSIDLSEYARDLSRLLIRSYEATSRGNVEVEVDLERLSVPLDRAIPLGLILNELITNSLKHAFPGDRKGHIRIGLVSKGGSELRLSVADDGVGVSPGFDFQNAKSMGLKTVLALVGQLGGEARFSADRGVECSITFGNTDIKPRA